jgi:hypothetical protein
MRGHAYATFCKHAHAYGGVGMLHGRGDSMPSEQRAGHATQPGLKRRP